MSETLESIRCLLKRFKNEPNLVHEFIAAHPLHGQTLMNRVKVMEAQIIGSVIGGCLAFKCVKWSNTKKVTGAQMGFIGMIVGAERGYAIAERWYPLKGKNPSEAQAKFIDWVRNTP